MGRNDSPGLVADAYERSAGLTQKSCWDSLVNAEYRIEKLREALDDLSQMDGDADALRAFAEQALEADNRRPE